MKAKAQDEEQRAMSHAPTEASKRR